MKISKKTIDQIEVGTKVFKMAKFGALRKSTWDSICDHYFNNGCDNVSINYTQNGNKKIGTILATKNGNVLFTGQITLIK